MNTTLEPFSNLFNTTTAAPPKLPPLPPLEFINNVVTKKLYPITFLLWIYLAVGVLGNSLVMFVYWARKKPVREDRFFIPVLALVDMASCVVSSSTGIYAQTYPLMFDNNIGCKMAAFWGIFLAGLSANFLVAIAVERYLKLCRPFGRQMTIFVKKLCILFMVIFSLVFAAPSIGVYRSEQVPMLLKGGFEIQTWKCIDVKSKEHEEGHIVYKVLLFLITILRFLVLLLSYGRIIWIIFRQKKLRMRMGSVSSISTSISYSHDVEERSEMKNINTKAITSENGKESELQRKSQTPLMTNKPRKQSLCEGTKRKQSVVSASGSQGRRASIVDRQNIRLTVIFILITLIYIITYGPKVGMMIMQTLNRNFWSSIPPTQIVLYRFLHSFYIFNNVVNPIVYGLMDKRFRMDCMKRFTKCK